jgi:hypothetical protein
MKKIIIGIALTLVLAASAIPAFAANNGQDPLDHVVISPDPAVVAIGGGIQQFTAAAKDADNDPVVGVTYVWEVVNLGGTIDTTGKFTAGIAAGTFTDTIKVTASKGGITKIDVATVIVATPGNLDHVVISPESATIQLSATQQFSAVAQDAFNTNLTTGINYTWEVINLGGGITVGGLFTAGATEGTFTDTVKVTATQPATGIQKIDTATVKVAVPGHLDSLVVTPDKATVVIGGNKQFTVTAKDAYGTTISSGVTYLWSLTGVGSIDQTGKFLAGTVPGTANVSVKGTQSVDSLTIEKTSTAVVTVVAVEEDDDDEDNFRRPHGWSHGKKKGWDGKDVPPGWSKGNKTGWDDEDSPPGLLKEKNGLRNDDDDEDEDEDDDN